MWIEHMTFRFMATVNFSLTLSQLSYPRFLLKYNKFSITSTHRLWTVPLHRPARPAAAANTTCMDFQMSVVQNFFQFQYYKTFEISKKTLTQVET